MVIAGGSPPASVTCPFRVAKVPLIPEPAELVTVGGNTGVVEKLEEVVDQLVPAELVAAARN